MTVSPNDSIEVVEFPEPESQIKTLISKFKLYKTHWSGLLFSVIVLLIIQTIIPFLTQSIIDRGVGQENLSFVKLIIIIQIIFLCMKLIIEFIRNIILLKISTLVSLEIISEYIRKVIKLPISFFNTKVIGDFVQRISDGQTIEEFLTYKVLDLIYSILTIIIFMPILCYYSFDLFLIFILWSGMYLLWSYLFFEKRSKINHLQFLANSTSQTSTIDIFNGIEDIKLNTCGDDKLKKWIKG